MMADESDDCRDVIRYWETLGEGWDAVFGSRFVRGGGVIDYPRHKLLLNRMANLFLRVLFGVPLNDFTNAFKAYRGKPSCEGCRPFLSPHFNLTVELPLKTVVRGYSWTVIPITWRNRRAGESETEDQGNGQPLSLYRALLLARKVFQPRRLPRQVIARARPIAMQIRNQLIFPQRNQGLQHRWKYTAIRNRH